MEIKDIRKEIEDLRFGREQSDDPSAAPGPDVDSLQNSIDRLVISIDNVNTKVVANKSGADLAVELGSKKVSGGDLGTTAETLATEKFVTDKFDVYEEKEITITPAVYGWKTITDLWSNPLSLKKYVDKQIRVSFSPDGVATMTSHLYDRSISTATPKMGWSGTISSPFYDGLAASVPWATFISDAAAATTDKISVVPYSGFGNDAIQYPVKLVEIWDIITPAVKATVLVKK